MTSALQRAFAEAAKLSDDDQELLAERLLAEISPDDEFDRLIASSADKLSKMAMEALDEDRAGLTHELDPDKL